MRSVLSTNLIYVTLNQAILSLGSAAIIIVLAHFMDRALFGELRYIIAVLAVFAFSSLPGVGLVINHRALSMSYRTLQELVYRQIRWGGIAFLGSAALAIWHKLGGEQDLAQAFMLGGIMAPIVNVYLVPGLICAGLGHFRQKVLIDTFIISSALIGATLGAWLFTTLTVALCLYFGFQAIATLLAFMYVRSEFSIELPPLSSSSLPEHVRDGMQLSLIQAPFSLIPAVEKIIVYLILGPVTLAIFVIAVLPIEHFKNAFRSILQVYMLPRLQKFSTHSILHWMAMGLLLLAIGGSLLALFIIFGMPILFTQYEQAVSFSLLLMLSLLPLPIHVIAVEWIAKRRIPTLWKFAAVSACSNVVLIAGGAWVGGLTGAVIAKIVYEILLASGLVRLDRDPL